MRKLTWLLPVTMILLLVLAATVSVSAQDDFEVTNLSISPDSVAVGEPVTITATVTNTKDTDETYLAELKVNGEVKDSQELPLGAGQSDNVTFTITADTPGDNLVELGGASEVFTVSGQASFDDFEVTNLSISPDSVAVGDYVTITATVTNTKDTDETYLAELKVNGEVKDSQELPLGAGQSDNVTFTITADTPGDNLVELGDASDAFTVTGQASFWGIFPSWLWVVIIAILVVLIILVVVIVAMPSRKKQTGAAIKARQGQPPAQAAMPFPIPSTGSTSPQMGYPAAMPNQTPGAFPAQDQFPAPGQMAAPYPQYARRPIFSLSNLTITPNQVKSGEPVTINAIVSNNGSEAGTYSVVLRINNVVEHITDLILSPGASQSATFTIIKDIGGDYYAEVDGLSGTFIVIPLVPANFFVSNLVIAPERAKQGETISISAMVTNNGEVAGNYSLVLKLKGAVETTEEISLGPGESQSVTFNITKNTPGFYNVELEGLTGRFVIEMEWQG